MTKLTANAGDILETENAKGDVIGTIRILEVKGGRVRFEFDPNVAVVKRIRKNRTPK